jgi:hypothetical protein
MTAGRVIERPGTLWRRVSRLGQCSGMTPERPRLRGFGAFERSGRTPSSERGARALRASCSVGCTWHRAGAGAGYRRRAGAASRSRRSATSRCGDGTGLVTRLSGSRHWQAFLAVAHL